MRGVDVIRPCVWALRVCIGRPWVYGLGIAGKAGAKEMLQGILADLDQSMGWAGIKDTAGCKRAMLRRVSYGAEEKSSNWKFW